jgi:DegV family protein with EDD domain
MFSIVRANKIEVNDYLIRMINRDFVSDRTNRSYSEYNGIIAFLCASPTKAVKFAYAGNQKPFPGWKRTGGVTMANVAILTDSTASIPEELLGRLHIHTVAYYIHRGQEVLRDLLTIQRDEFLHWLTTARFLPTTASPGPGDYFEAYKQLASKGQNEILSIQMSSKISGGYQAATVAQSMMHEECPDVHIEVVDTQSVALSQGWMVIEAARGALAGLSLDRLLERVIRMIPLSHMIQTADTLKYLYMGGRIGKAQELLGSLLNIKPLIGIEEGVIVPLGRARSRGQAYQLMAEMVADTVGQSKAKIAYVHAGAEREIEKLKAQVESRVDVVESLIGELSPALAVHAGPGMTGLCYYRVDP